MFTAPHAPKHGPMCTTAQSAQLSTPAPAAEELLDVEVSPAGLAELARAGAYEDLFPGRALSDSAAAIWLVVAFRGSPDRAA